MCGFPQQLAHTIAVYHITPWSYDQWVAGHEAAHAVVALHYGGTVSAIYTSATWTATGCSRARTEWHVPTVLHSLNTIAAGPAYDQNYSSQFGIPPAAVGQVMSDRQTGMAYLSTVNPDTGIHAQLWNCAVSDAAAVIAQAGNLARIAALQPVVYQAIQDLRTVTGQEVLSILAAL